LNSSRTSGARFVSSIDPGAARFALAPGYPLNAPSALQSMNEYQRLPHVTFIVIVLSSPSRYSINF
jgi:hypothetical protein